MMLIKYCDDDQNGIHTKLTKIFANFICGGLLANSAHKDLLGLALPASERGNTALLIMGSTFKTCSLELLVLGQSLSHPRDEMTQTAPNWLQDYKSNFSFLSISYPGDWRRWTECYETKTATPLKQTIPVINNLFLYGRFLWKKLLHTAVIAYMIDQTNVKFVKHWQKFGI